MTEILNMERSATHKTGPVIVIGMHRSGTSLVTNLLEKIGLFGGWRKPVHNEAAFFSNLNKWLIKQSGATWDNPKLFDIFLQNEKIRFLAVDYVKSLLDSPRVISYLGPKNFIKYRKLCSLDFPWGWKDPRNTFTLPIWLEIFKDAKVIHIYRHGVDVAQSLIVRQEEYLKRSLKRLRMLKSLRWVHLKESGFIDTVRGATLNGGFSLWEEYVRKASEHVNSLGDRAIEIRYEDFLENPSAGLNKLAKFCCIQISENKIQNVVKYVNKERAFSYKKNPELRAFSSKVATRLQIWNYK